MNSIYLPGNVTSFGFGAFYGCKTLAGITLSEGMRFRQDVFNDCPELNVCIKGTLMDALKFTETKAVIASDMIFGLFYTPEDKRLAAKGFLSKPQLYKNELIAADNMKYVISQRKKLLPEILYVVVYLPAYVYDLHMLLLLLFPHLKTPIKNAMRFFLIAFFY